MSTQVVVEIPEPPISYPIKIGENILEQLSKEVKTAYTTDKVFIVTDTNVADIYLEKVRKQLEESGFEVEYYILPAGEKAKTAQYLFKGYEKLLDNNFSREDPVLALGGGVVGDLAGYLAASFMRGIPLVQIPTTLLAQVDSSVGGKTAINHNRGKNLIGAFYQPDLVLIDVEFLNTLPRREIKTGLAEVIKYGFIYDHDFFTYLEQNRENIYNLEADRLEYIIKKSCQIKADIVSRDQRERSGTRALLNFGHTAAHALEAVTEYGLYNHGEAVAVGMRAALHLSRKLGYLETEDLERSLKILDEYNLKSKIEADIKLKDVYTAMQYDKKARQGQLRWILLPKIGKAFIEKGISKNTIMEVLGGLK